ncbi:MAG TPA: hypothetical protein VGS20_08635 [Candidatus Acidoferrales bacterium]|nr:hypothetical protein [Candidatus Acidoferrales bacterium]
MSSDFPGRPKLLKGALVVFGAPIPVPTNIIIFQYNPETMTRKVEAVGGGSQPGGGGSADPCKTGGDTRNVTESPIETYQLAVELDAADQLEDSDAVTMALGLNPALAALELLLYPASTMQLIQKALLAFGSTFTIPPVTPVVLFVWGPARVVPVQVTSVSITEQAFDQLLNPIQAKVDLGLRSLTQCELDYAGAPFDVLGIVNQVAKEVMSRFQVGGLVAQAATQIKGLLPF